MKHPENRNIKRILAGAMVLALLSGCGTGVVEESEEPEQTPEAVESTAANALEIITDMATTQYFTDEAVAGEDIETILTAGANAPSAMNGQPWHFSVVTDKDVLQQISDEMSSAMSGMTPPPDDAKPLDGSPEYVEASGDETSGTTAGAEATGTESSGDAADGGDADAPEASPEDGDDAPDDADEPEEGTALTKAGIADAPLAIVISCTEGSELDAGIACQTMSAAAQLLGYGTKVISSPTMALNGDNSAEYAEMLGIPEGFSAVAVLLIGHEDTSVDESADGYTSVTERNPLDMMVTYVSGEENAQ